MFHIFHVLQSDMVFEIINSFPQIFNAVSSEKSCSDVSAFPVQKHWRQDSRVFSACWILFSGAQVACNAYPRTQQEHTPTRARPSPSFDLPCETDHSNVPVSGIPEKPHFFLMSMTSRTVWPGLRTMGSLMNPCSNFLTLRTSLAWNSMLQLWWSIP